MLFKKTQAAFSLCALKLFAEHPRVFFWTFTFTNCIPDAWAMNQWNMMWRELSNWHGAMIMGLRVVEPHEWHGLHFHCLLAPRMSVHVVRRCAKRFGFGRIHVKRADHGSILYLAAYLTGERGLTKGARSWARIGGFKGCTVRNVEVDSIFHRNIKSLTKGKRMHYLYAREVYRNTVLYGKASQWEKPKQNQKRDYLLNPHRMYEPMKRADTSDPQWANCYPRTVFSRNCKNTVN